MNAAVVLASVVGRLLGLTATNDLVIGGRRIYFLNDTPGSQGVVDLGALAVSTPAFLPASNYGIVSGTVDQTALIQEAHNQASNAGVGLYFPPGLYCYAGAISGAVSMIGAGSSLTELRNIAPNGALASIQYQGISNVVIQDIGFTSPNTPYNSTNTSTDSSDCLFFTVPSATPLALISNITVKRCTFSGIYGVSVLLQNVQGGLVKDCYLTSVYRDGIHITGLSTDVDVENCHVLDGGDDAFAVVGYASGTPFTGQPERIKHIGCSVVGVKFGAGFKYAGSKSVQNIGCRVNGTIPATFARAATDQSCCALIIQVDSNFNTYGNEDVEVTGFSAVNSGRGADPPFGFVNNAVQVEGAAGQTTRNIRFTNLRIRRSASIGFFAQGHVSGGIDGLYLDGLDMIDTTDPNGYTTTAGQGQFPGVSVLNTANLHFKGTISDSGGSGMVVDVTTCTGRCDIDLVSYRVNAGGASGSPRIIDTIHSTGATLTRLTASLFIAQQAAASPGSQYGLAQPVFLGAKGIVERFFFQQDLSVTGLAGSTLPVAAGVVGITSSPMTYTNTTGGDLLVRVAAGTATGLTVARGQSGNLGTANLPITGELVLVPGESIQLTYSAAGTLSFTTTPAEGL